MKKSLKRVFGNCKRKNLPENSCLCLVFRSPIQIILNMYLFIENLPSPLRQALVV